MSPSPPARAVEKVQTGESSGTSAGEMFFLLRWERLLPASWPYVGQLPPAELAVAQPGRRGFAAGGAWTGAAPPPPAAARAAGRAGSGRPRPPGAPGGWRGPPLPPRAGA